MRLERRDAATRSYYKAVLGVPHGCEGSDTIAIHVDIPQRVTAVKPMPNVGCQPSVNKGPCARSYLNHGRSVAEGVKRVSWRGGSLTDEHYDEFVFVLELGKTLYLRVLQECARGGHDWHQIPAEGSHDHLGHPAPSIHISKQSPSQH